MTDVIHTKLFRTGGSVAVRIPAGWLNPDQPVSLHRDPRTGRLYLNQGEPFETEDFFDFLRGEPFLDDTGLNAISLRREPPRATPFDEASSQ